MSVVAPIIVVSIGFRAGAVETVLFGAAVGKTDYGGRLGYHLAEFLAGTVSHAWACAPELELTA
jgi:hypothetical protein